LAMELYTRVKVAPGRTVRATTLDTNCKYGTVTATEGFPNETDRSDRFVVTWETELPSPMQSSHLYDTDCLEVVFKVELHARIQALRSFSPGGVEYYKPGDFGMVTKLEGFPHEKHRAHMFQVLWEKSGRTSSCHRNNAWKMFKIISKAKAMILTIDTTAHADHVHVVVTNIGGNTVTECDLDLDATFGDLEYKLRQNFPILTTSPSYWHFVLLLPNGVDVTNMRKMYHLKNAFAGFSDIGITSAEVKVKVQDIVQALPGKDLCVRGKEYYREGDMGVVVALNGFPHEADSADRFQIMWYRTMTTSSCRTDSWAEWFQNLGQDNESLSMQLSQTQLWEDLGSHSSSSGEQTDANLVNASLGWVEAAPSQMMLPSPEHVWNAFHFPCPPLWGPHWQ